MIIISCIITILITISTLASLAWLYPSMTLTLERGTILGIGCTVWGALILATLIMWIITLIRERALHKKLQQSEKVISAEREFVSLAAHQLRTPLSALKWSLSMLYHGDVGSITQEQKEFVLKIQSTNDHLVELVNDLLNVSRIEEQRMTFQYSTIDATHATRTIIDLMNKSYHEKNLHVITNLPDRPISLTTDPTKLDMILSNIIDNAYKYTSSRGSITVSMSTDGRMARWVIKDSGMGIPKPQQCHLFEKFFRADNAMKAQITGTGLGLYLAQKIVQHDLGSLLIHSTEHKGTEVTISLPLSLPVKKSVEQN